MAISAIAVQMRWKDTMAQNIKLELNEIQVSILLDALSRHAELLDDRWSGASSLSERLYHENKFKEMRSISEQINEQLFRLKKEKEISNG